MRKRGRIMLEEGATCLPPRRQWRRIGQGARDSGHFVSHASPSTPRTEIIIRRPLRRAFDTLLSANFFLFSLRADCHSNVRIARRVCMGCWYLVCFRFLLLLSSRVLTSFIESGDLFWFYCNLWLIYVKCENDVYMYIYILKWEKFKDRFSYLFKIVSIVALWSYVLFSYQSPYVVISSFYRALESSLNKLWIEDFIFGKKKFFSQYLREGFAIYLRYCVFIREIWVPLRNER